MIALPSQSVLKRIDDKGEVNLPGKFTVWWLKKKMLGQIPAYPKLYQE